MLDRPGDATCGISPGQSLRQPFTELELVSRTIPLRSIGLSWLLTTFGHNDRVRFLTECLTGCRSACMSGNNSLKSPSKQPQSQIHTSI